MVSDSLAVCITPAGALSCSSECFVQASCESLHARCILYRTVTLKFSLFLFKSINQFFSHLFLMLLTISVDHRALRRKEVDPWHGTHHEP